MAGARPQNRGNRSSNRVGATVSRRLRAAGFNVSPSARKHVYNGLFVSGKEGRATVLVDLGAPTKNKQVAAELIAEMADWPQAGDIDANVLSDGAIMLWVRYLSA
jgi:hypothetical protein